jgi:hypothetical protein
MDMEHHEIMTLIDMDMDMMMMMDEHGDGEILGKKDECGKNSEDEGNWRIITRSAH